MRSLLRNERGLLLVAAAIVLALLFSYGLRHRAIPSVLRYVPLESEVFVVSAPLGELWRGVQPHLAYYFEMGATEGDGSLRRFARGLRKKLKERGIELDRVEDLPALGIDAAGPAAMALVPKAGAARHLVVLPLLDSAKLMDSLERYLGEKSSLVEGEPRQMRRIGNTWVAFSDDRWALLSDDASLLRHALEATSQRLEDWRSSDRVGRSLAAPLRAVAATPRTWLRGRLRGSEPFPSGGEMHFVLTADDRMLGFDGRVALSPGRSKFVADLLSPELKGAPDAVLPRTDLGLALSSARLPSQLRELLNVVEGAGAQPFGGLFAPVLAEVRGSDGIERLSIAVSDSRSRVPGVVLGLQMSAADADAFVLRLQSSLRMTRDRDVLRGAAERQRKQTDHPANPSAAVLLDSGRIAPEVGALWSRYRWEGRNLVARPPLAAEDFANETYTRKSSDGDALRYLMPPFTDNDLEYRFAEERETLQVDALKADRYRLCSGYRQNTLWIGNDAVVLGDWLERLSREAPDGPFAEVAALAADAGRAKALALALPARLREAGQLYPDGDINSLTREGLGDLAPYDAALLGLSADSYEQELHVWVRLLRR